GYQGDLAAVLDQGVDSRRRQQPVKPNIDLPDNLQLVGARIDKAVTPQAGTLQIRWAREQADALVAHPQRVLRQQRAPREIVRMNDRITQTRAIDQNDRSIQLAKRRRQPGS